MTTPVVNYIPQFVLTTGLPAASYYLKAYEAGATSSAVTTYTSKSDGTGGTKFQLNALGQPASGGTAFAPHYAETVDVWIFPTSAAADANDTSSAIQVINASVINPFAVLQETVQKVSSSVGSTANAITADLSVNPGSLADPLQVRVELAHGSNTSTTPTFNLNSLGAKTIVREDGSALYSGDIPKIADFVYSETSDVWYLMNPIKPNDYSITQSKLGWYPLMMVDGLTVTNNASDSSHDLDIAVGSIADSTQAYVMTLGSALTKKIDATFAVGDDAGGFSDQDTLSNNGKYNVYLISKASDPTDCDVIIATSQANALADTVAAAAGFDIARRIDGVVVDGSQNILTYTKQDRFTTIYDAPRDTAATYNTSGGTVTADVPPSMPAIVLYRVRFIMTGTSTGQNVIQGVLTSLAQTNNAASVAISDVYARCYTDSGGNDYSAADSCEKQVLTDSSSQFRHREAESLSGAASSKDIDLSVIGWYNDLTIL